MEEADLLCDKIAIMAEGDLAAVGTSMDLKQRFGVGYRLTVVKQTAETSEEQVENRCGIGDEINGGASLLLHSIASL